MSALWARTALKTYRLAGSLAYPFLIGLVNLRAMRGKEDRSRRGERYGYASEAKPEGPLVWFHAASVGETIAVLPLIERVEAQGVNVILTTGTTTSASIVRERLSPKTAHQYVPLDIKPVVKRFLNHWKPDLAIFAESEIWPMTILELQARRVPLVLVNARMSDRSYARWCNLPSLAEALFESVSQVVAQSDIDEQRFVELGAKRVSVSGNLKVDTDPPPHDETTLNHMREMIGGRMVWTAASTHAGEEELVADVHALVQQQHADLLTVLVPRHPKRGPEVAAMLTAEGFNVVTRSSGDPILPTTHIFLGDTIGEMGLFMRLGEVCFLGKSLGAKGGQNPIEPAMIGSAVLSGVNVHNFRPSYKALIEAGGARLVSDEAMLAEHISWLLSNPEERQAMIDAGQSAVEGMRGALERTYQALDSYIRPLRLKQFFDAKDQGAQDTDASELETELPGSDTGIENG